MVSGDNGDGPHRSPGPRAMLPGSLGPRPSRGRYPLHPIRSETHTRNCQLIKGVQYRFEAFGNRQCLLLQSTW